MKRPSKRLQILLAIALLLYACGYVTQFIGNYTVWQKNGGMLGTSLPFSSLTPLACLKGILWFPYSLYCIAGCAAAVSVMFLYRKLFSQDALTDSERNFDFSAKGTYGTSGWMQPREVPAVLDMVSDLSKHMERIPMGTYTLTETMAPTEQGYVRAESVTFEVGPTGDIQRVEMKDDFTKVEISKADMTDGRELPGAKLKITDASGNTIAEWETNGQPHRIERLKPGEYTLTETAAPAGYLLSEEVHFTVQETGEIQKVTMYDAPAHALILTKRDIATNAKLTDARLTIRDAYGTTIDRWTTTDGDHAIRVLPERSAAKDPHKNLLLLSDDTSEHVYTMVEELAPDGYLVAESITFKVMQMNDALVVFIWQDGGWQKSSEGYLAMYDERTDTPVPLMKTFPQTGSIL